MTFCWPDHGLRQISLLVLCGYAKLLIRNGTPVVCHSVPAPSYKHIDDKDQFFDHLGHPCTFKEECIEF